MKTLLILRHAKSSWADAGQADFDRPLNKRGRQSAPLIGQEIRERGITPWLVLSSTALRARLTTELVNAESGFTGQTVFEQDLYLAPPETYLERLRWLGGEANPAMVVGHNPGLEMLVGMLTGQHASFPTAALAIVDLPIDAWSELRSNTPGRLVDLVLPREL
ncbi:SixA phosphatase family protein [Lignipirellula cremea]|uniref:Histidine phosphatase superfamily (Branch 1) n=1 Tax=Lignipirellula cremea TaxID=2528010 RepID=A0A518DQZ0_9BACT|nr:histidine phosphatase family protein [Lignipirellula cremea]QDU94253.1 Histidine phosphatase superfamily (branch 1) [Lignipirellula cremea]